MLPEEGFDDFDRFCMKSKLFELFPKVDQVYLSPEYRFDMCIAVRYFRFCIRHTWGT